MIEVEIKIPVSDCNEIENKLKYLNFQKGELVEEVDTYFTSDVYDFKENDMALRIRRTKNIDTKKCRSYITYKGVMLDEVSMTREELETELEDGIIGEKILKAIGFREVIPVKKLRQYYLLGNLTVCIDHVENLGNFLEAEIIVSAEREREEALCHIRKLLEKLGYSMKETTRISYLSMLEERMLLERDNA